MKRLISVVAIICAMAMVLSMTGCGESKKQETTTTAAEAVTEAATEAAAEDATEAAAEDVTEAAAEDVTEAAAEDATEAAAEDTTEAAATAAPASDELVPSIIIEYGDYDAMEALAADAVNMRIQEGTVAKISGIISTDFETPSIMESDGAGKKKGIRMIIEGDFEVPKNGSDIEVIGTFTKGQLANEFHVLAENITVK